SLSHPLSFFLVFRRPPTSPLLPYTTLFRSTDRRGSHATLPGLPVETPASLTFPVGARGADRGAIARTTLAWEPPPAGHAEPLGRSEEHTSELQSRENLVCRLLLEKKKRL